MKIDIYAHYIPPKFVEAFCKKAGRTDVTAVSSSEQFDMNTSNIDRRIEIMEKFPGLVQVLTPTIHTLELYTNPADAAYLAKIHNDEMAELVLKYPDKFIAAAACIPMNNIDEAIKETERTITEMGFRGILINASANGKPLDSPDFTPLYECLVRYDLPIWIHPTRLSSTPDYPSEDEAKYLTFLVFGWPYETTIAMTRLVCSGILEQYPNLKFITHHAGGMIPFFIGRIGRLGCAPSQSRSGGEPLTKIEYLMKHFRKFYADTALYGNTPGLMCANAFFGAEHLLFGTDMPYGPELGERYTRLTIEAVDKMSIPESDKKRVYEENAKAILRLDV